MTHHCAARGCRLQVSAARLMCLAHWRLVPKLTQRAVWAHYRRGQERDGWAGTTSEYRAAVRAAVNAVAERERE